MTRQDSKDGPIRVVIQQPALPAYRIPVFRELANRKGIDLEVWYGSEERVPNVPEVGFVAKKSQVRAFKVGARSLRWDSAHLESSSKKVADVVVYSWNAHYASLIPGLVKCRNAGIGTVLWGHGYSKKEALWRAAIRNWIGRRADALLFYSNETAERFARSRLESERIFVAANTLDQGPIKVARETWLDRAAELADFRRRQGLGDGPVALFVSRFAPENCEGLLIEATAKLANRIPGLRTVLIGTGKTGPGLKALAKRLGIADRIIMPGEIYREEELAPWFLTSDVFVYPANVGLSLIHAMGYDLPVVVGDDRGAHNPEIVAIEPGVNGATFSHGDAGDLADTLEGLFTDRRGLEEMSRAANRTVNEKFTLTNMVDGLEAAIRYARR